MFQITGPDAIVHPRTVVVHATDAPVADATVMRLRRFERLTLRAHGQFGLRVPLCSGGHGRRRHGPGIGQGRLDVTRQRERREHAVRDRGQHGNAARFGE